jgi:hypothetical protein
MGAITNDLSLARLHMLVNCCFLTQLQQMVDFVVFHYYLLMYQHGGFCYFSLLLYLLFCSGS